MVEENMNQKSDQGIAESQIVQETQEADDLSQCINDISTEADLYPRSVQKLKQATSKQKPTRTHNRLIDLKRRHHYSFVGLMETFQNPMEIEDYRRKIGYPNCMTLLITVVYAKCGRRERKELWDSMIATIEDTIKVQEWQFEMNPTRENKSTLQQAQAELTRYLHLEEEYWKQKAGMKWFNKGDRNTKFFHSYVRGTRRKLALKRIQDQNGVCVETTAEVGDEAKIEELPTEEEVKEAVFSLNSESASGPDGFTGLFYQKCWDTIKEDVTMMVRAFFCGYEIPKFISHIKFVLLPKKKVINTYSDMRPTSLSSFAKKVLSKVLHNRISEVLPRIISSNQTGIVNGRIIVENVLLAQEVVKDINIRASNTNVVIKLDMAKAYDRLSWILLTRGLRQFGFGEIIIDMVWRLISNNWYSVLINGQSHGFFRSSRRVKQGDPLSPTLFIIAVEVLSRSLNKFHEKPKFISYSMPKWSPQINHFSYVDDTLLFFSGERDIL
ncbi:uncharacterized protein LOC132614194 [Lycium barbarum]|uniref:uncharacterized protein LOC132614194 n=1 Tax=Lycium barbarum TaxID=112863 RepID=UPI00293E6FD8|nr:uncharacterized protein LOC132614194 [Lycium barbarum]